MTRLGEEFGKAVRAVRPGRRPGPPKTVEGRKTTAFVTPSVSPTFGWRWRVDWTNKDRYAYSNCVSYSDCGWFRRATVCDAEGWRPTKGWATAKAKRVSRQIERRQLKIATRKAMVKAMTEERTEERVR